MSNLVPAQHNRTRSIAVSKEFDEHLQKMEQSSQVSQVGMDAMSEIYTYGEYKTINSLVAANLYRNAFLQSGGSLTPAEEKAYIALRLRYLERMNQISESAGAQVLRDMADAPRPVPQRSLLDILWNA